MQLVINGKQVEITPVTTLKEVVMGQNLPELQVVLELNGELIPRDNWGQTPVQAGDTIEILRFVGGG